MKNVLLKIITIITSSTMISGCSVLMASKKEGTSIEKIQNCRSRGQFISCGATVISSEKLPSGELIEVYQYQKEKGSATRALMHGALDVATFGIWEVVGTPLEICADENTYFTIKVYYTKEEILKKVELI